MASDIFMYPKYIKNNRWFWYYQAQAQLFTPFQKITYFCVFWFLVNILFADGTRIPIFGASIIYMHHMLRGLTNHSTRCLHLLCEKVKAYKTTLYGLLAYKNGIHTILRLGHLVFCSFIFRYTTHVDTLCVWKKIDQIFFSNFLNNFWKIFSKTLFWTPNEFLWPLKKNFFLKIFFIS